MDGRVQLLDFPPMSTTSGLEGVSLQDFSTPYHGHCKEVLRYVSRGEYSNVEDAWQQFWAIIAAHFRPLLTSPPGACHVDRCDEIFFDALHRLLIVNVLHHIPEEVIKDLRYFAKCMEPWLMTAMEGYPARLVEPKLKRVRALAHALRRYTSLNHLASAVRNVLEDAAKVQQMLQDLSWIDFVAIQVRLKKVGSAIPCQCSFLSCSLVLSI